MVWYLSLVLENSQPLLLPHLFFSVYFSHSSLFDMSITHKATVFTISPQFLEILLPFSVFFLFDFQYGGLLCQIPKLRDSFLNLVQSTKEFIKGIAHFLLLIVFPIFSTSFLFFLRMSYAPASICVNLIYNYRADPEQPKFELYRST